MSEQGWHLGRASGVRRFRTSVTAALLLAASQAASSQPVGAATEGWTYELTPYLWGSGLKGDVQAGTSPRTSVDMKFSDIFDVLDFGAMGTFEARKGRWGILVDAIYLALSDEGTATRTGQGPIGATVVAGAKVDIKQTMLSAGAMYRAIDTSTTVDLVGGLRYTNVDVESDIDASLFLPEEAGIERRVSRSGNRDWFDPYVGVRWQRAIGDRWRALGYAEAGGFGAGSDLTWQVIAGANYARSKRLSFKFGYRYMSIDYDRSGVVFDVDMHGPYAGVGVRF